MGTSPQSQFLCINNSTSPAFHLVNLQCKVIIKFCLHVTHICFQQVVHGALSQLFRLVELLQGLSDLFILDFTLPFFFIVIVQAATL